jgi:hypothetical protein
VEGGDVELGEGVTVTAEPLGELGVAGGVGMTKAGDGATSAGAMV